MDAGSCRRRLGRRPDLQRGQHHRVREPDARRDACRWSARPTRSTIAAPASPGRTAGRTLRIPLSGPSVPASLKRIELDVQGRRTQLRRRRFAAAPNQQTTVHLGRHRRLWPRRCRAPGCDGQDRLCLRRRVPGARAFAASFAASAGRRCREPLAQRDHDHPPCTRRRSARSTRGPWGSAAGAWSAPSLLRLRAHGVLHLGEAGERRSAESLGRGHHDGSGDRTAAAVSTGMAFRPRRRSSATPAASPWRRTAASTSRTRQRQPHPPGGPDGIITTVAGNGTRGSLATAARRTQARIRRPRAVAVGPDGSLYIADTGQHRIRRVGPDGIITTVAGNGQYGFQRRRRPATQAALRSPERVGVGAGRQPLHRRHRQLPRPPGGSATASSPPWRATARRLRRRRRPRHAGSPGRAPDRRRARAGRQPLHRRRSATACPAGGVGRHHHHRGRAQRVVRAVRQRRWWPGHAALLFEPRGIAVGADGSLYIVEDFAGRVRRVAPDGIITTVAGEGHSACHSAATAARPPPLRPPARTAIALGPGRQPLHRGRAHNHASAGSTGARGLSATIIRRGVRGRRRALRVRRQRPPSPHRARADRGHAAGIRLRRRGPPCSR